MILTREKCEIVACIKPRTTKARICAMHEQRLSRHGSPFARTCILCGDVVDDEEAPDGQYRCSPCVLKTPPKRPPNPGGRPYLYEGRKRAAKRGRHQGRIPYGYKRQPFGGLVIDPEAAAVVRHIFKMYWMGSMKAVLGVLAKAPEKWTRSRILYVLRNPVYRGMVEFNGRRYHGVHQPILTAIEFNRVQKKLGERRKR